ncbi:MAG TPA: hypothetical protein VM123_10025, partial [archaeon]|nr:hypothetical protein [archaeon]
MKSVKIILQLTVAAFIALLLPDAYGDVVLSEDFESGSLGDRWERYSEDPALGGFEERTPFVHTGGKSYLITTLANKAEEKTSKGYAYKESDSWIRTWLIPGYDRIYIRFYVKFAKDFDSGSGMHWIGIAGFKADDPRSRLGHAGQRPDGTDRFSASLDPVPVEGMDPPGT